MPERPLLILPRPGVPMPRRNTRRSWERLHRPSRERQAERLTGRFARLEQAFDAGRAEVRAHADGLLPEEVVVLETVGSVKDFIRAVDRVPGMEWLAEVEGEYLEPDDDFFVVNERGEREDRLLRSRLFLVFANQEALRQMLALWRTWLMDKTLPHGLGRWKKVFAQLKDVRPWGVRDRLIETGVLDDWREWLRRGKELIPCEIELWCRKTPHQRRMAQDRVVALIEERAGHVVDDAAIEEIGYHALLVQLPAKEIARLIDHPDDEDMALVRCEQIQFFRARGQMSVEILDGAQGRDDGPLPGEKPGGTPVVALFDGLPVQGHRRLEGRLIVDDPDGFEEGYATHERRHGTAMASLIIHGDLNEAEKPLRRPLYVRPIFRPDGRSWDTPRPETVPEDILVVDLIHRAVRRLFEGEGDEPPAAPGVSVINLSIGIRNRAFERAMSPLARLLDWLSWKYGVLFVVSAGNHPGEIELDVPREDLGTLSQDELQSHVLRAVATDARNRRLLSPAEAVNAMTVAAVHEDASPGKAPPRWFDPYENTTLPSPINAQGMGYRRAIKPDVLAPGGRVVVQEHLGTRERATLDVYGGTLPPGQCVAAPGRVPGDQRATWYTRGTSNATALISRGAALLYEVLEDLREEPGGDLIDTIPVAVWLKALIGHAADWGEAGGLMREVLGDAGGSRKLREYIMRLLGYGAVRLDRVRECTALRATALSGGTLRKDERHVHRLPLPASLSGRRGLRRLIVTLAWLSPVNPRHQGWRRAHLWFRPTPDPLGVSRRQADWRAVQRGTLQHEIFEGESATAFLGESEVEIEVTCRADAGALMEEVPYALVATLEVAEDIGIEIYDEIRAAVHARVRVAPRT